MDINDKNAAADASAVAAMPVYVADIPSAANAMYAAMNKWIAAKKIAAIAGDAASAIAALKAAAAYKVAKAVWNAAKADDAAAWN